MAKHRLSETIDRPGLVFVGYNGTIWRVNNDEHIERISQAGTKGE